MIARAHLLHFRRASVTALIWLALAYGASLLHERFPAMKGVSKALAKNPYPFIEHLLLAPVAQVGPYLFGALALFFVLRALRSLYRAAGASVVRILEPR